jgi:hypothetical protein
MADSREPWLAQRLKMSFRPSVAPIGGPVAKLGGDPIWLDEPFWPISSSLGTPMTFVGQFPLPGPLPRMGYLFITQDDDCTALTFEPDAGENALIVQPDGRRPSFLTGTPAATGPTLWRRGAQWTNRIPVELHIDLNPATDAAKSDFQRQVAHQDAERHGVILDDSEPDGSVCRSYLGGSPLCWQPTGIAIEAGWKFFFQLDGSEGWGDDLYALNFGGGTGYAYLSGDELEGRFRWDCV